ncbi:hypothetical protein JHD50_00135 [Sulfurimonas sp. MAG313]|nr:hypothetical protein [Sulfurimonas sp. MAG313]MDF1879722.1 hypothetical protein [Sulfurimonas sp. MAG313]
MSIFSKFFSSSTPTTQSPDRAKHLNYLKNLFPNNHIYTQVPLFNKLDSYVIEHMMLHPHIGIILLNYFDYDAVMLKGLTVSSSTDTDTHADIKTDSARQFISQRFDEIFHKQLCPVRSILICPNLSSDEFDALDKSFHKLIPKDSVLFSDSTDSHYKKVLLKQNEISYDTLQIKRALFSELVMSKTRLLANEEQERIIHLDIKDKQNLVYGLPGSGKTSTLVSKALYEKMKNPNLKLLLLGNYVCNMHKLQELIFSFVENSHWGLNPADILVSSSETIRRRISEKEKFDLIVCDDINEGDIKPTLELLEKEGKLLASSHYKFTDFNIFPLEKNFLHSPALCAACEGHKVEYLKDHLSFLAGNTSMHLILTLAALLKECEPQDITVIQGQKDDLLNIKDEINDYFEPITYLFDEDKLDKAIGLYPLSHLPCLLNKYIIILVSDTDKYDPIELITRAQTKTFILSESEEVYNIINTIKGNENEIS